MPAEEIAGEYIRVRKAKITQQKHGASRILFFHWTNEDEHAFSEIFEVFPRKQDSTWIAIGSARTLPKRLDPPANNKNPVAT